MIGGEFTSVNGVPRTQIARLNSDGSLDQAFNLIFAREQAFTINKINIQTDGKIVVSGDFNLVNGIMRYYHARLNPDGTTDQSFNSSLVIFDPRFLLPNGKFLAMYRPPSSPRIVRLNSDGSQDTGFAEIVLRVSGRQARSDLFDVQLKATARYFLLVDFTAAAAPEGQV